MAAGLSVLGLVACSSSTVQTVGSSGPAPSRTSAKAGAASGFTVTPTSGPVGTKVSIRIAGCSASRGNYALSFNDADVSASHSGSAAHVHSIDARLSGGALSTSYNIPRTSGPNGMFYFQCGDLGTWSRAFVLTGQGQVREFTGSVVRVTRAEGGYRVIVRPARFEPTQDYFQVISNRPQKSFEVPASLVPSPRLLVGAVEITTRGSTVIAIAVLGG